MDEPVTISAFRAGSAWATMVAHMVEMGDTPTEWDLVQFVTSMAAHRAGSPRNSKTPDALCFVEDLEQNRDCLENPLDLVQSQDLPTMQSQDLSVGSPQLLDQVHLSGSSSDLFH